MDWRLVGSIVVGTLVGNWLFHGPFVLLLQWAARRAERRRTACEICGAARADHLRMHVGADGMRAVRLCRPCFAESNGLESGDGE